MTAYGAHIDYGYGLAIFHTRYDLDDEKLMSAFYRCANQCFGIRKSIGETKVTKRFRLADMPGADSFTTAAYRLVHSGDTIAFNDKFEKLLDEWGEITDEGKADIQAQGNVEGEVRDA